MWFQGIIPNVSAEVPDVDEGAFELGGNAGFVIRRSQTQYNIFIPRYYDPETGEHLKTLEKTHHLVSIASLVDDGVLALDTGIEVGKMAYGTGPVPFIRTSDISNWELKADPKQSVSQDIYEQYLDEQDVQAEDIFVVRDGTYLVGTSCILTPYDTRLLYCGGIYKIRVEKKSQFDPYLLLAALNCPIVRKQMKTKQFTRDIIDTLGKRILEVVLPIPIDEDRRKLVAKVARETVETRVALRNRATQIRLDIEGVEATDEQFG